MADIIIKYNDEVVLTVTDEEQLDLSHMLKTEDDIDDNHTIKGWIVHTIRHFTTRKIESCGDSIVEENRDRYSEEETSIPSDRGSQRTAIRGRSWYKNRDTRDEEERERQREEREEREREERELNNGGT